MQSHVYGDYVKDLHRAFEKRLDFISSQFNFDLGAEFEIAVCEILSDFLPSKYGVCRGFVIDANGAAAGDDIIIFDQERFPTLRCGTNRAFDKKNKVPIEAVYAYIEAKNTLNAENYEKAIKQVQAVKELCASREKVGIYQHDPYVSCNKRLPEPILHLPEYRNPVFGMVLSRHATGGDGKKASLGSSDVDTFLRERLKSMTFNPHLPDLIVAGPDNFLSPAHRKDDGENLPSLYYIPGITTGYQVLEKPGLAFGAALAQLAGAIDWVRLGSMPWHRIVNDARSPEAMEPNG